jgi:hypothetical protein
MTNTGLEVTILLVIAFVLGVFAGKEWGENRRKQELKRV